MFPISLSLFRNLSIVRRWRRCNWLRANYFPTLGAGASFTRSSHCSNNYITENQHEVSLSASWELDVWGKVRRQVEAGTATAEASFADLQAMRLSMQAELASDYFQLRTLDAQKKTLDDSVAAYSKALELTQNRYNATVAAKADVVAAQTQLETTKAQAIDVGVQRAQYEHAIAVLMGKPPADFSWLPRNLNCHQSKSLLPFPLTCWNAGRILPPRSGNGRGKRPDRRGQGRLLSNTHSCRIIGLSKHRTGESVHSAEFFLGIRAYDRVRHII